MTLDQVPVERIAECQRRLYVDALAARAAIEGRAPAGLLAQAGDNVAVGDFLDRQAHSGDGERPSGLEPSGALGRTHHDLCAADLDDLADLLDSACEHLAHPLIHLRTADMAAGPEIRDYAKSER